MEARQGEDRMIFLLLLLLFAPLSAFAADNPDPKLTPGVTNPVLTKDVICSKSFRTGPYRKVTQKMHREVWKEYGMDWDKDHSCCEDDHLISIELGGSNDNRNRWPQPWDQAREKDKVENALHRRVCQEGMSLEEAQREIRDDWRAVKIK